MILNLIHKQNNQAVTLRTRFFYNFQQQGKEQVQEKNQRQGHLQQEKYRL